MMIIMQGNNNDNDGEDDGDDVGDAHLKGWSGMQIEAAVVQYKLHQSTDTKHLIWENTIKMVTIIINNPHLIIIFIKAIMIIHICRSAERILEGTSWTGLLKLSLPGDDDDDDGNDDDDDDNDDDEACLL